MNLNKKIKSIVITYEDEECVQLRNIEAIRFQEIIKKYYLLHQMIVVDKSYPLIIEKMDDITNDLNYVKIRNGLKEQDIEYR